VEIGDAFSQMLNSAQKNGDWAKGMKTFLSIVCKQRGEKCAFAKTSCCKQLKLHFPSIYPISVIVVCTVHSLPKGRSAWILVWGYCFLFWSVLGFELKVVCLKLYYLRQAQTLFIF
jgi:hypothetical protein